MKKLLFLAALLLPSLAQADAPVVRVKRFHTNGVNCPAAVAPSSCKVRAAELTSGSASWQMDVFGYSKLIIQINHTFAAATALAMTCEGSLDGGATYARITATAIAAGVGTVSRYADAYATGSASTNILLEYGVAGYDKVRCDLGDTGATTDTDTIFARVSVGD